MVTTVQPPPGIKPPSSAKPTSGNGGWRNLVPDGGGLPYVQDQYSPPPASTAVWVGIAAITMSFMAFTSALVVRKGGAPDWQHLAVPPILYFNTLVLLASSFTLHIARKRVASFMGGIQAAYPALWLHATLGLGLLFVAGQYLAWIQLRARGFYIATSPNSSFFYVFTTIHALHVLGGLAGLAYVIRRFHKGILRKSTLDAASHYWHFMDVLWIYLLYVLSTRI